MGYPPNDLPIKIIVSGALFTLASQPPTALADAEAIPTNRPVRREAAPVTIEKRQ